MGFDGDEVRKRKRKMYRLNVTIEISNPLKFFFILRFRFRTNNFPPP